MAVTHKINTLNINDKTNYKVLFFNPGNRALDAVWTEHMDSDGAALVKSRFVNREIKITLGIYGTDEAALATNIKNLNAELVKNEGVYTYNQGGTLSDVYFDIFRTSPIFVPDKITFLRRRLICELTLLAKPFGRGSKVTVGSITSPAFSNIEVPNMVSITGVPGDVDAKARLFINKLTGTTNTETLRLGRYTKGAPLSDFSPVYEAEANNGDYGADQADTSARGGSCIAYTPAVSGTAYNICRITKQNVQNPGFETYTGSGNTTDFANWVEQRGGTGVLEAYTADKYEGLACAHFNVAGYPNIATLTSDYVTAFPNVEHEFSFRYNCLDQAQYGRVRIYFYNSSYALIESWVDQTIPWWLGPWALRQYTITPPANTAFAKTKFGDEYDSIAHNQLFDTVRFQSIKELLGIQGHRGKYRLLIRPKTADTPANVSYRYKLYCGDKQDWAVKTGAWVALSQTAWKIYDLGYIEIPSNEIPEGIETYQVIEIEMKSATGSPGESRLDCVILMPYGDGDHENSVRLSPGLFQVNDIGNLSSIDDNFFLSKNQGSTETLEKGAASAIKEGKPITLAPGTNKIVLADSLDGADSALHKYNIWYEHIAQYLFVR